MKYVPLGRTGLKVSRVCLGTMNYGWRMGEEASVRMTHAAIDAGIDHLDTAHAYGKEGESEVRVGKALAGRREEVVLATKVGLYWNAEGELTRDSSPAALRRMCEASLKRLDTDRVELLYLHIADGKTPIAESAGELKRLCDEGKTQSVGVSNTSVEEMEQFAAECPIAACQPRYNMLQRDIESDVLPWCIDHGVSVLAYEPLALGLLTGKFTADHVFAESDWRRNSPLFQGEAWRKNLDMVEKLRPIADDLGCSMAALVVAWTIHQKGITAALCGAKRPEQICDTVTALGIPLESLRGMESRFIDAGIATHFG